MNTEVKGILILFNKAFLYRDSNYYPSSKIENDISALNIFPHDIKTVNNWNFCEDFKQFLFYFEILYTYKRDSIFFHSCPFLYSALACCRISS